jgi:hypothetical protein
MRYEGGIPDELADATLDQQIEASAMFALIGVLVASCERERREYRVKLRQLARYKIPGFRRLVVDRVLASRAARIDDCAKVVPFTRVEIERTLASALNEPFAIH